MSRPPLPPFTRETAIEKVRLAEDGWNSRDAAKVALAYTTDTRWRNRAEFLNGRDEAQAFLTRKWAKELDYRLIKELWAFEGARIAVRYAYEYHDDSGNWFRAYGNENWEFDADGLMRHRHASINEHPITEADRKFRWPLGRRPDDHPGLSDFGF
ncbi:nuclear transport factor 2 family protein [Caulobacter sp.]|uniref:nuclear transport factor 2 family protein n=1 Tax=Caulobacter sp. TaxID=78 RepID=UPI001B25B12D|nr:nuclear transport factor 2 family protein [Caulobacter sp.]MBO9545899.1 nuclear transport factor 2 family protein [Caulobacter sp.]